MKQKEVSMPMVIVIAIAALVVVVGFGVYILNRQTPLRRDIMARQAGGKARSGGKPLASQTGMVGNVSE